MIKRVKRIEVIITSTVESDDEGNPKELKRYRQTRAPTKGNVAKKYIDETGIMSFEVTINKIEEVREMDMDTFIKYSEPVEEEMEL